MITTGQNKQVSISLQGTDPDKEDKIIFELVQAHHTVLVRGFDKAAGTLTYIPSSGFTGPDSLRFKVVDNNGVISNEALVSITVTRGQIQPQTETQTKEGIVRRLS